jgi:hypothetical protein
VDLETIHESLHEMQLLLRGDGADLVLVHADPKTARIAVRVDLAEVQCPECVLPPDLLEEMLRATLHMRVREEFELVVDDPRSDRVPGPARSPGD